MLNITEIKEETKQFEKWFTYRLICKQASRIAKTKVAGVRKKIKKSEY